MSDTLTTQTQSTGSTSALSNALVSANGSGTDLFTTLLVAQIQNQNPLEPNDPSDFVNQLTQLSQMESLQSLSSQSAATNTLLDSLQTLALGNQVGNSVDVVTDHVQLDASGTVPAKFTLASAENNATLVLTGADGVKHNVDLGSKGIGEVSLTLDPVALGLPAGTYDIAVKTTSGATPAVAVTGRIQNIRLSTAGMTLTVSHLGEVSPGNISQFNGKS
ncbi:flagellar basal body rod modification protein [Ideonella azotifigens]|nr:MULTISPECIES: flagellar hook capping FlgD N-terminal domain-containing protein [Ideonella]MCD2339097.1 flagellar basal body rod modification protein [Ideonella azotifigens]HSI50155.1 flagellar hook capping FlgD N-terminal domain-containing protein [Ideonella sp.]